LRELAPKAATIAMVVNPPSPDAPPEIRDVQVAAQANGLQLRVFNASTVAELDTAFTAIEGQRLDGLLMGGDPFFLVQSGYIVERIARIGLIAVHPFREFAEASGLMSYGTNIANTWRQVGIYSGRILKGAQPADLPIEQPAKFELIINLKAAKQIGLTIPPNVLARADRVIK